MKNAIGSNTFWTPRENRVRSGRCPYHIAFQVRIASSTNALVPSQLVAGIQLVEFLTKSQEENQFARLREFSQAVPKNLA